MVRREDLVLVHMPFGSLQIVPLGMGALLASAKGRGLRASAYYPGFLYIEMLGFDFYRRLYHHTRIEGLGNLFFSFFLFRHRDRIVEFLESLVAPSRKEFETAIEGGFGLSSDVPSLVDHILEKTDRFLDAAVAETLSREPSIVACSALDNQHVSSLVFLERIKKSEPRVTTIMGGPSLFGTPGLATVRNFPWVDYVFSGEGDEAFPAFCLDILRHERGELDSLEAPEGFLSAEWHGKKVPVARVEDLESLPIPDFDDYFKAWEASGLRGTFRPVLTYEAARGCWKGKASLCRFCGLNYDTVDFRAKSPEKALREVLALRERYGTAEIYFTESIIDMRIFRSLLPALTALNAPLALFFQIPSKLSWPQVKDMAKAGVVTVLPGIETLQDDLLVLLNKNTAAVDGIALLKYCASTGLTVAWNLLVGIPGERPEYYRELAGILPLLFHFNPPAMSEILFQRNAYYWRHPEEFGLSLEPSEIYSLVYPGMEGFVADFADSFSAEDHARQFASTETWRKLILEITAEWFERTNSPDRPLLVMMTGKDGCIEMLDSRPCASSRRQVLNERESAVYRLLWEPASFAELEGLLFFRGWEETGAELKAILDGFVKKKTAVEIKGTYLGLAVEWSGTEGLSSRNDAFFLGSVGC